MAERTPADDAAAPGAPAFATLAPGAGFRTTAPDGAAVEVLLALRGGSMARFTLAPGQVTDPVTHRTVEEIWLVLAGRGEIVRRQGARHERTALVPGTCVSIPLGTAFRFRAAPDAGLEIVCVTMPPWPGPDEAVPVPDLEA